MGPQDRARNLETAPLRTTRIEIERMDAVIRSLLGRLEQHEDVVAHESLHVQEEGPGNRSRFRPEGQKERELVVARRGGEENADGVSMEGREGQLGAGSFRAD